VHYYLFAWPYWSKGVKEWNTLKDREKLFFERVAEELGGSPDVLYALAKVLNEVASPFATEGVLWLSGILEKHPNIWDEELEANTIYYLERFVRGYVLRNRHKVRITPQIRDRVLIILNVLLEKGSVTAYLVREDVF
jgi:hypothetical protein